MLNEEIIRSQLLYLNCQQYRQITVRSLHSENLFVMIYEAVVCSLLTLLLIGEDNSEFTTLVPNCVVFFKMYNKKKVYHGRALLHIIPMHPGLPLAGIPSPSNPSIHLHRPSSQIALKSHTWSTQTTPAAIDIERTNLN